MIGEFEVLTNRFDAQLGHAGSLIVNAVTKSGTDKFSGSAFYYFRDDSLNADDFFTGRREPYRNTQFGGTFGGPIWRGETQFFTSYERQAEPTTKSANTGFASLDAPVDADDTKNLGFWRVDYSLAPEPSPERQAELLRSQPAVHEHRRVDRAVGVDELQHQDVADERRASTRFSAAGW